MARKKPELKAGETNERPVPRCMLYSESGSQIFVGEEAIDAALDDGWEDAPVPQTAQAAGAAAFDEAAAARLGELDEQLKVAIEAADDATTRADNAVADAREQFKRADSAEKKLAAAEKKIAANARK